MPVPVPVPSWRSAVPVQLVDGDVDVDDSKRHLDINSETSPGGSFHAEFSKAAARHYGIARLRDGVRCHHRRAHVLVLLRVVDVGEREAALGLLERIVAMLAKMCRTRSDRSDAAEPPPRGAA
ncbi:MAG: hypothetical protein WCJ30_08920, partial [Deltaproteobacteria bacterium]